MRKHKIHSVVSAVGILAGLIILFLQVERGILEATGLTVCIGGLGFLLIVNLILYLRNCFLRRKQMEKKLLYGAVVFTVLNLLLGVFFLWFAAVGYLFS